MFGPCFALPWSTARCAAPRHPASTAATTSPPRLAARLAIALVCGALSMPAQGQFTDGNLLLSGGFSLREIREYTVDGTLVQSIPVPAHPSNEQLRDLVLDESGTLHVYHGTFNPRLRTWNGAFFNDHQAAGWSTVNNITYGGLVATGGYVFATDMDTQFREDMGIVRFDTNDGFSFVRFADTQEYRDLAFGLDCRLYALREPSAGVQTVDVFDPLTMQSLGSVALSIGGPIDVRAIAVDASGQIYGGAWDRNLYRFDASGTLVATLDTGGFVQDIALDVSGRIAGSHWLGGLFFTTTAFAPTTGFDPGIANNFIAWVSGERPASCEACFRERPFAPGQWSLVSLPCDVGADDTLEDVVGDDLPAADYGTTWAAFERDEAADTYRTLGLGDPMDSGRGYWLITLDSGRSLTVEGTQNTDRDLPLTAEPAEGVQNMVGHPFPFEVCWADVQVVDGANILSLEGADPLVGLTRACDLVPPDPSCVMSRVAHRWNGAAYDAFDGGTASMQGSLEPFSGFWVRAFKPGIALRIPDSPGTDCTFCFPEATADAGADRTICAGESVTLGAPAQPGHAYSWSPGGETTAQITVSPADSTLYTLTATTFCGTAQDTALVTVDTGGGDVLFDFEGDVSGWAATGLWHRVDDSTCFSGIPGYVSPTHSFYYGRDEPACDFNAGATAGTLTSPPISDIGVGSALTFQHLRDAEQSATFDRTEVRVLHPGGTDVLAVLQFNASPWTQVGPLPLAPYAGETIRLQFSFDSVDGAGNLGSGWMLDDVVVSDSSTCSDANPTFQADGARDARTRAEGSGSEPRPRTADDSALGPDPGAGEWLVRLAAAAGDLRDAGAVFGHLVDAEDGFDYHDLPERPPFGDRYLAVVFPQHDWGDRAGDYASDFRAAGTRPVATRSGGWRFDVLHAGFEGPVTLSWAAADMPPRGWVLVDVSTGTRVPAESFGSYTFEAEGDGRRSFRWLPTVRSTDTGLQGVNR